MYDKFTFFYSGPFSQWHIQPFSVDGVQYNCAEQYMMHQKALLFGDDYQASKIMEKSHPRDQKAAGRCVVGFDANKWNAVARDLVYKGNYAKFTQNPDLLQKLEETVGTELVEASPYDKIWGIGLPYLPFNEKLLDRKNWKGTNWLGEVLTKLRDDLKAGIQRTEGFNWS